MIDFHSHILPGVDDGSKNLLMSLTMLRRLYEQGVTKVAATPHFYADKQSPDSFARKRDEKWKELRKHLDAECPEVILGAEVYFFEGISKSDSLSKLKIGETPLILVEMPFRKWNERITDEILELNAIPDVTVIIAHIERYFKFSADDFLDELIENGVYIQMNAENFENIFTRGRAIDMLRDGKVSVIGTDCHNLTSRPPNMAAAISYIKKQHDGDQLIKRIETLSNKLLCDQRSMLRSEN